MITSNDPRPIGLPLDFVIAALPKEANATQDGDAVLVHNVIFQDLEKSDHVASHHSEAFQSTQR